MIKFISATIIISLFSFVCDAQEYRDSAVWHSIEHSIISKSYLTVNRNKIEQLKPQIWKAKDYPTLARFYYYQMLIDDLRTEDTLYFKNSAFIDSLLEDKNTPVALKTFLHVMQANRLSVFRYKDLPFSRKRYQLRGLSRNYAAAFNDVGLDSIIEYHFNHALKNALVYTYHEEEILWLSSDPLAFTFHPALIDIIMANQITHIRPDYRSYFPTHLARSWMNLSQDDFIKTLDNLPYGKNYASLNIYRQWWQLHRNDKRIYYCIAQLARKYVNSKLTDDDKDIQDQYEKYLNEQTSSSFPEVKALAIQELIGLWAVKGKHYNPEKIYSYRSYGKNKWDTSYQYFPAKALQLYEEHAALFEDFPRLKNELLSIKNDILLKELNWSMEDNNPPASPLLVKIRYRNVAKIYYRLVKLNDTDTIPDHKDDALKFLFSKPVIREKDEAFVLPPDYNNHATIMKLDALPTGKYCVLFSDQSVQTGNVEPGYQPFAITAITVLNDDNRVYILDRKTGVPLKDAIVKARYTKAGNKTYFNCNYQVNKKGYFDVTEDGFYQLKIYYQGDTVIKELTIEKNGLPDEVFDKDVHDDLTNFYIDNASVQIYTDRSIYRPGQKVYFKGIFITRNPETGAPLVMNQENMGQKWFEQWREEEDPWIFIRDPFNRKMDSLKIVPDEYGAVNGVFTIPKMAPTGDWEIDPGSIDMIRYNNGNFSVEEYKRPTYELTVGKPTKTYTLNDTISFTIHARSFAGVNLNNIPVKYTISRDVYRYSDKVSLVDSIAYTDGMGQLIVKIYDTAFRKLLIDENEKFTFRYNLEASTTDATGESHEVEELLNISNRPVNIEMLVRPVIYVKDWRPILITAEDDNGLPLSKELTVKLNKISTTSDDKYEEDLSLFADQHIYQDKDLQAWFPQIKFSTDKSSITKEEVYETTVNTGKFEKLRLPSRLLKAGKYELSVTCLENGKITGERTRELTIFDIKQSIVPDSTLSFSHLPVNVVNAGDTMTLYSGSSYDSIYILLQVKYYSSKGGKLHPTRFFVEQSKKAGITSWKWKVPEDAVNKVLLSQLFIVNNKVHYFNDEVQIYSFKDNPQIIIEQFRRELSPGTTATFSVSVKTKVKKIAAELMSVMYDASLDRIQEHNWKVSDLEFAGKLFNDWSHQLSRNLTGDYSVRNTLIDSGYAELLKRLKGEMPGIIFNAGYFNLKVDEEYMTTKRLSTGNVTNIKRTSSTITLQGIENIVGDAKPLIIIDGVIFTGKLSEINVSELVEGIIIRDADATAIYGSSGSNGVLLLSTKGPIVIPDIKVEPPVKIRSNFNETAFFFPAVHADKDGYYHFPFTIPESTTEWNWKILAHTKNAKFAYAERKLTTHLPLMVQPNMPRLLYQGDKMVLQTRISNLDSAHMNGYISCKVEDEVTGEDLTSVVISKANNAFDINGRSNTTSSFTLTIPNSQLHPVRVTITAQTGIFADGEEHIIPILSKRSLVKELQSFRFSKTDTVINIRPALGQPYGMSVSINPAPHAAIINALPYLSGYSFNCAEQTFNKLLAHAMAVKIMKSNKDMQQVYSLIRDKVEKDTVKELPASPWLDITNKTKKQQKELFELLNKNESERKIKMHLQRLYVLQNNDGGLAWFDGGSSNEYISEYVLAGFGKLLKDSIHTFSDDYKYKDFIKKLISYCDTSFNKNETEHYIIARSYWTTQYPLSTNFQHKISGYLAKEWKTVDKRSLLGKARLITATLRSNSGDLRKKALEELESLQQLAIKDADGLRWKDIADADDLETNSEETFALLAEAFEGEQFKKVRTGILQWLLNTQSEHHWQTTKATAAAIRLLDTEKESIQGTTQVVDAMVGNNKITVSNDLLSGNLFSFVNMSATPATISLKKEKDGIAKGDLTTYYFRDWDQITTAGNNVKLTREFLHDGELKIGDKVKVVLHITSDKPLRYVHLEDKRAAAFEPSDGSSGYKYADGFSYYRSVRDDGSQFFIDFIPSGEHTISYELTVANEGEFSCGPASLECMYRPDIHAYSSFRQIKTTK